MKREKEDQMWKDKAIAEKHQKQTAATDRRNRNEQSATNRLKSEEQKSAQKQQRADLFRSRRFSQPEHDSPVKSKRPQTAHTRSANNVHQALERNMSVHNFLDTKRQTLQNQFFKEAKGQLTEIKEKQEAAIRRRDIQSAKVQQSNNNH